MRQTTLRPLTLPAPNMDIKTHQVCWFKVCLMILIKNGTDTYQSHTHTHQCTVEGTNSSSSKYGSPKSKPCHYWEFKIMMNIKKQKIEISKTQKMNQPTLV